MTRRPQANAALASPGMYAGAQSESGQHPQRQHERQPDEHVQRNQVQRVGRPEQHAEPDLNQPQRAHHGLCDRRRELHMRRGAAG